MDAGMTKNRKVALITGITGQDGAYLAEMLWRRAILFMASSDVHRPSTPAASSISTRILMSRILALFCITGT